ncbi:glycine betaine ABC transporter substrate-binding protein [Marinomonas pollencensis]|uniref:Glycine betaine/proline transport system substrate-binding protein n=1 Tax=Marinomonas pollencensis TaxID=491954 RepID=A0A3E0DGY4_9GAMM|nr:glycine betaine ABC transporter substrate-binding protein [Marinomonas pollencensis]REG81952.1 glycine betaine/proline transport system substrate-binding protein [Marinomonas pollencensis]
MKHSLLTKMMLVASISTASVSYVQAADKVMIAELTWPGAKIIGNLIKVVIQEKLGGEADMVPSTNSIAFSAMDGGRGDIDVHPDVWLPNQQALVDEYVEANKSVTLSKGYYEGRTGFCVPKYMSEQYGIKSVYDLATPEAQKLFDSDGDGMGEIWAGGAGWTSTNINKVKARDYGIDLFNTVSTEDEAIFYNRLETLYQQKKGVAFYCYVPHYVHALYDVVLLEEPKYDAAQYKMLQPQEDPDWYQKSSITSGDPVKHVHVAYSKTLETRAPDVAKFLTNISLSANDVSSWTYQVVIKGKDPEDVVRAWVNDHGATVDKWLGIE